jgi:hypothetical protein
MLGAVRRLAFVVVLVLGSSAYAADGFVAGIDDLPLMPGLRGLPGDVTVFDAPGGRIVEAWAEGTTNREAVLSFYNATLPQLGWTTLAPGLFRREGEALRLEFPPAGPGGPQTAGRLVVRFYLSPG